MIDPRQPQLVDYDFSRLKNMYADLVLAEVAELIEASKMCRCADCVLDVVALALNSLPPAYWVSGQFNAFTSPTSFLEDERNRERARDAVRRAVRLVERNPHH